MKQKQLASDWVAHRFDNLLDLSDWLDNFTNSALSVVGFEGGATLVVTPYKYKLSDGSEVTDCTIRLE